MASHGLATGQRASLEFAIFFQYTEPKRSSGAALHFIDWISTKNGTCCAKLSAMLKRYKEKVEDFLFR